MTVKHRKGDGQATHIGDEVRRLWVREDDGTYTKMKMIYGKDMSIDWEILESDISEKEFFKRKLAKTL